MGTTAIILVKVSTTSSPLSNSHDRLLIILLSSLDLAETFGSAFAFAFAFGFRKLILDNFISAFAFAFGLAPPVASVRAKASGTGMSASSAAFASSSPPLALSSRSSFSASFFLRSWKKNRSTWYSSFLLFATQELKAFLSVFFSLLVFSRRHFLTSSMVILFFVSSLALFRVAARLPRDPSNASLMISSFGLAFHSLLRSSTSFTCFTLSFLSAASLFSFSFLSASSLCSISIHWFEVVHPCNS